MDYDYGLQSKYRNLQIFMFVFHIFYLLSDNKGTYMLHVSVFAADST